MKKIIAVALLAAGCASYNKALIKCEKKCGEHPVSRVEYNYSNNRYDICICEEANNVVLTDEELHD